MLYILVLVLFVILLCKKQNENFSPVSVFSNCKCNKCDGKNITNGLCFENKDLCEKTCSNIYDKVGIKRKVVHKCKRDLDDTFICSTPDWTDRYVR
jgi:hypothetical protein